VSDPHGGIYVRVNVPVKRIIRCLGLQLDFEGYERVVRTNRRDDFQLHKDGIMNCKDTRAVVRG